MRTGLEREEKIDLSRIGSVEPLSASTLLSHALFVAQESGGQFKLRHTPFEGWRSILPMPKYVIERQVPGAGAMSQEQLQSISQTSCGVLRKLGTEIQWVHSYVAADKIYCIYIAPNEELVKEHAKQGGFPANSVEQVRSIIDPTTAEG